MTIYRLIEEYTGLAHPEGTATTFPGPQRRTLPAPCLVEDDDGMRLLLVAYEAPVTTRWIAARVWHEAQRNGAHAIVWREPDTYTAVLAEHFMDSERRLEDSRQGYYGMEAFRGEVLFDAPPSYLDISVRVRHTEPIIRPSSGFVQLHAHSEKSALDGYSKIQEMVDAVVANGDGALAITDHGVCAGHPELQSLAAKADIKPIFGIEAYFVDDRRFRPMSKPQAKTMDADEYEAALARWKEEQQRGRDYWHLVLWAESDEGLRNLWALNTEATRSGQYYKPRMDWELLEQHASGLLVSTACLRGPLSQPLLNEDHELASMRLGRLRSIFGDRIYAELHTNGLGEQRLLNERLVSFATEEGLPLVAVTDSHYAQAEHKHCHKVWMALQTDSDLVEDGDLFAGDHDYHLMGVDEVRSCLDYLPPAVVEESIANTQAVADRCSATIGGVERAPVFSRKGTREERIRRDVERLVDICLDNWHKVAGRPPNARTGETYEQRFEREMEMLIEKGFCGYFLMVSDYCRRARQRGILVGPGRGSGGGCLVAYLAEITDIDPIEADLIFERFLTKGRMSLPDFDVDFPASMRDLLTQDIIDTWGEDHVVRVGTHGAYKNKGIIRGLSKVFADKYGIHRNHPDINAICNIIEDAESDSAGLGKRWDDVMAQTADLLEPYIQKYPDLFDLGAQMTGRLSLYGKHPAGIVIDPEESLEGRLPMRWVGEPGSPIEEWRAIAEWDMDVLEGVLHLVKFDLLTLRNLDTLQECMDLIRERHGETINPYDWSREAEYADPEVWDMLGRGETLGCFQIETYLGTKECKVYQPRSIHELADVITLIRPGPRRSRLTEIFHRRRRGEEPVTFPHPLLETILARTNGCILYQEDVMAVCMTLAGYNEDEADAVRKMLGKKKVEEVADAGIKFVDACVANGIDRAPMEHLWAQMAEFAKYSFNRAHAYGYATVAYWCAWFKHHYPAEFLVAVLSTVEGKRIPDFVHEAHRRGFKVLPPDVNESNVGFTAVDDHTVRYGLASIKDVGDQAALAIIEHRPYETFDDFLERRGPKCNSGHIGNLAAVGAFDSLVPNRRALEQRLENDQRIEKENLCRWRDEAHLGPGGIPCIFDWSSVPVELTAKGTPKKSQKGAPKRCTRGCWKYDPIDLGDPSSLEDYTPREIRERERAMLGLYLSSTPFDDLSDGLRESLYTIDRIEAAHEGEEPVVACIVTDIREKVDRNGDKYAFLGLEIHDGNPIDAVCFKSAWKRIKPIVKAGPSVHLAVLLVTDRGLQLRAMEPPVIP